MLKDPESQNGYSYAHNDPVNLSDPSGEVVDTIWDIGNVLYDITQCEWGDAAFDAGAMFIPFVPAGTSKLRYLNNAGDAAMNIEKVSDNLVASKGIDPHAIKRDYLGNNAPIAQYDLYKDKNTGEILIMGKGGTGQPMQTGRYIK